MTLCALNKGPQIIKSHWFYKQFNNGGTMKPIRQAELDHYKDQINSKFRTKASAIDSEIHQQAQDLSDKKKPSFAKACKVDKKIQKLIEAEKKYRAYVKNKDDVEERLLNAVKKEAARCEEHLTRLGNVRDWNRDGFNGYEVKDIYDLPSIYFTDRLDSICFEEAEKHIKKNHKLRHVLQSKKEYAENILYSGGDINSIMVELTKAFKSADIEYNIPKSLLALPS